VAQKLARPSIIAGGTRLYLLENGGVIATRFASGGALERTPERRRERPMF
jgi:hypothetical protein